MAERLKSLREKNKITQEELAEWTGISYGSIQAYERGQIPKGDYLLKLADFFDCSTDWLLTGRGPLQRLPGRAPEEPSLDPGQVQESFDALQDSILEEEADELEFEELEEAVLEYDGVKKALDYILKHGPERQKHEIIGAIYTMAERIRKARRKKGR
ncbi:MAG: helix-turn-helix transcriptional regulator [Nitrospinaceae bacterium]|nr:helix-turn-helix transcriptional regulator [Nitrospinaceae bacterium]